MSVLKGKTKRKKMHKTVQICAQNEDAEVCEDVDRINFLREENLGGGEDTQGDCWRICVHLNPERERETDRREK